MMARITGPGIPRYSRPAALLHWAIAGLIVVNLAAGFYCAAAEGPVEQVVMNGHKVLGLAVLALSLVRLGWRAAHRPPPLPPGPALARLAAHAVHAALYGLMLAIPFTGWLVTSLFPGRHPIDAGLFDLPFLPITPDKPAAFLAHDLHSALAWAMIALVCGHVGAALYHQFVLRDRLIERMGLARP